MQVALETYLMPDARQLAKRLQEGTGPAFTRLNQAVLQLIDDWSMVSFTPLDYSDEDSIAYVLSQVHHPPCGPSICASGLRLSSYIRVSNP